MAEDRNPDDSYVLPVGRAGVRGKQLQEISLRDLDSLLAWLEDKGARPDVQEVLARYLKDNHYDR
jgi:hypothetical protein